jgi:hypothetical protein
MGHSFGGEASTFRTLKPLGRPRGGFQAVECSVVHWCSRLSEMESAGVALVEDLTATRDGTLWLRAEVARLSPKGHAVRHICVRRAPERFRQPRRKSGSTRRSSTTKPVGERPHPSRCRARAIDSHGAEAHWQCARCPSNGLFSDQLRTCNASVMVMSRLSTTYTRTSESYQWPLWGLPEGGRAAACQIPGYASRGLR